MPRKKKTRRPSLVQMRVNAMRRMDAIDANFRAEASEREGETLALAQRIEKLEAAATAYRDVVSGSMLDAAFSSVAAEVRGLRVAVGTCEAQIEARSREADDRAERTESTFRTVSEDAGELLTRVQHIEEQVPCKCCGGPSIAECRKSGPNCAEIPTESMEAMSRRLRAETDNLANLVLAWCDAPSGEKFDAMKKAAQDAVIPF